MDGPAPVAAGAGLPTLATDERSAVAGFEGVDADGVAGGPPGDAAEGRAGQRDGEAALLDLAEQGADCGCLGDGAVVERQPGLAGPVVNLGHVACPFEDGNCTAERSAAGFALEGRAVGIDDAGLEAFEDAFAGLDGLGGDGVEEVGERLMVQPGEEGIATGVRR